MLAVVLGLLALSPIAHAGDSGKSIGALIGTNPALDDDPATLRLSFRGEVPFTRAKLLGAYLLVPITLAWTGQGSVSLDPGSTIVEIPLSARLRLFPSSPVRLYGDLGTGVAFGSGWFVDDPDAAAAWMTRAALGFEVGPPEKWLISVEPLEALTFMPITGQPDERAPLRADYGLMVGILLPL